MDTAEIARRVRAWRLAQFGEQTRMRNLAQITEEVGEIARAAGKEEEGIRAETRGNVQDEIADVVMAACGMAAAEGMDLDAVLERRLTRMEGLDFRPQPPLVHYRRTGPATECGLPAVVNGHAASILEVTCRECIAALQKRIDDLSAREF